MGDDVKRLSSLFKKLGADDADEWAYSQITEGIPQLARYLFLRQAWRGIVSKDGPHWMDAAIDAYRKDPQAPYGGVGWALQRLRAKGATSEELTQLVRGMQAELLFSFCYLLEDPGELEQEVSETCWGLFLLDDDMQPVKPISGLHESVLETDPVGNEVRLGEIPD